MQEGVRQSYAKVVRIIAEEQPSYRIGGDSRDGTCDCVGLGIGALRRMGVEYDGEHSTNWAARREAVELWEIMSVSQLRIGDNVLKAYEPGEKGWDLPERFKTYKDKHDYYHMGVVVSVAPLQIVHCTDPTCKVDTKLGKWSYAFMWRQLSNAIDAPKQENPAQGDKVEEEKTMEPLYEARVVLSESKVLNIRAGRGVKYRDIGDVPDGATVKVLEDGDWPLIEYEGLQGFMSGEYLQENMPEHEPVKTTTLISEDGTPIVLQGVWRVTED